VSRIIPRDCPECGGVDLRVTLTASGALRGPRLLPGLGSWFAFAPFTVVVCRECGLTRLFAQPPALEKLDSASQWQRVPMGIGEATADPDTSMESNE
jgi:hypothetical protein